MEHVQRLGLKAQCSCPLLVCLHQSATPRRLSRLACCHSVLFIRTSNDSLPPTHLHRRLVGMQHTSLQYPGGAHRPSVPHYGHEDLARISLTARAASAQTGCASPVAKHNESTVHRTPRTHDNRLERDIGAMVTTLPHHPHREKASRPAISPFPYMPATVQSAATHSNVLFRSVRTKCRSPSREEVRPQESATSEEFTIS
jgi:hypothetical protein